jgi:hypothetical protein
VLALTDTNQMVILKIDKLNAHESLQHHFTTDFPTESCPALMLAGADAFQPCALTPATLRAPRAAAMKHAAMRIARKGTSRVFMVCVSVCLCVCVSVRVFVPVCAALRGWGASILPSHP